MTVLILIDLSVFGNTILFILLCAAVVYTKSDLRKALQEIAKTFHLVICQRIHRIDQDGANTGR